MTGQKIIPHLWFDGAVEDAAVFYTPLVPGSGIGTVEMGRIDIAALERVAR